MLSIGPPSPLQFGARDLGFSFLDSGGGADGSGRIRPEVWREQVGKWGGNSPTWKLVCWKPNMAKLTTEPRKLRWIFACLVGLIQDWFVGVNGHINTMPAREINPFTALTRSRSQFLRTQWRTIISECTRLRQDRSAIGAGLIRDWSWCRRIYQ